MSMMTDYSALITLGTTVVVSAVGVVSGWVVFREQRRAKEVAKAIEDEVLSAGALAQLWTLDDLHNVSRTRARPSARRSASAGEPSAGDKKSEAGKPDLLQAYHAHGLTQSRVSFAMSVSLGSLGFVLIVGTALASFFGEYPLTRAILPMVSGVIVDAAAGLIFVESNKARENMAAFFDRLRADNKLGQAIALANEVADEKVAANLKAYLSLHLAGVDVGLNSYRSVVGLPAHLKDEERSKFGAEPGRAQ